MLTKLKSLIPDTFYDEVYKPGRRLFYVLFARTFLKSKLLHIVTAANSTHFYSLLQFLRTVQINEDARGIPLTNEGPGYRLHVYDLGLTEAELRYLAHVHPKLQITRFPFEDYPKYFDLSLPPDFKGQYAWKPSIVHEVYAKLDKGQFLIWQDSGNFIKRKMWIVRSALFFRGFYTRPARQLIGEMTHPETIGRLGMERAVGYEMICGCLIAIRKDERNDRLVKEWRDGALDKSIIAPEGSIRLNHRQDQSVVSLLYYKHYPYKQKPPNLSWLQHEIHIHMDIG